MPAQGMIPSWPEADEHLSRWLQEHVLKLAITRSVNLGLSPSAPGSNFLEGPQATVTPPNMIRLMKKTNEHGAKCLRIFK